MIININSYMCVTFDHHIQIRYINVDSTNSISIMDWPNRRFPMVVTRIQSCQLSPKSLPIPTT